MQLYAGVFRPNNTKLVSKMIDYSVLNDVVTARAL